MLNTIPGVIRRVTQYLLGVVRIMVGRELALGIIDIIQDLTSQLNVIVRELADLSIIDTEDLSLLGSAEGETWDEVHNEENDAGAEEGVCGAGDGVGHLVAKLHPVVVDPAARDLGEAIEMCYVVSGEECGEDVANETSDGVLGEDIESIVNTEDELELGGILCSVSCGLEGNQAELAMGTYISTCGTNNTVDHSSPGGNETRAGSDGYETRNDTGAETNSGPLALKTIIQNTPGDTSYTSSQVGDHGSHDGAQVGSESGTSVESKPANP